MRALLSFLWAGCWHRWSIYEEGPFRWTMEGKTARTGKWYHLRCDKCGNMKGKNI